MTAIQSPLRCRVVLIAPEHRDASELASLVAAAAAGGDVASLIMPAYGDDETTFQRRAEAVMSRLRERDIAVIIAGDTRVAGRLHADGIHLETGKADVEDAIARRQGDMIVGVGGAKTRHAALELGETRPDYLFFGRFGYDNAPQPHARNLGLGQWWAEMTEIPCIVMAGCELESIEPVAATGVEFVALSRAIFTDAADPGEAVARANALLDQVAPRFEG